MSSIAPALADRFGYLLKVAQHALRTAMDDALRPFGITTPQYAVLSALDREPGMSNADLARAAHVTAQSMQGIVANMERDKLVVRSTDPAPKRILRTELTAGGRRTLARADAAVAHIEETMLKGLDTKQRAELNRMLKHCARHAQEDQG